MTTALNASQGALAGKKDTLVKDLKAVVADADELLKEVGRSTAGELAGARTSIEGRLGEARSKMVAARVVAAEKARHAADVTHEYVKDHPWRVLGISAAVGLVAGFLLRRR